jgi:diguanylate cyclase (GGDEF)-like protein
MLEGHFFNPAIQGATPALIQIFGTVLFCSIFLFLWRHSGVVYFGFWSLAWAVESLALVASFAANWTASSVFLWFRVLLEFFFALSLLTAARSAATATARGFGNSLRSMLLFPGLLLVVYVFVWRLPLPQFLGLHAGILALIYGYSFLSIGVRSSLNTGIGGRMLRFTLVCLFLQYLGHAMVYLYSTFSSPGQLANQTEWMHRLTWVAVYDLVPQTLLAFSAMAMWIQTQQDTIGQLRTEVISLEKAAAGSAELDHLTGLRNRMALDHHLDEPFTGVVAVCDLDYFKDINDRFGHLVGDEVLRSVGNLIRASIRVEDDAFRWGGDEFVIVFRHQDVELARGRMAVLEERLHTFRIRGHGTIPLGLSWGAAEGDHQMMRPILEEADRQMYERKRQTHARKG